MVRGRDLDELREQKRIENKLKSERAEREALENPRLSRFKKFAKEGLGTKTLKRFAPSSRANRKGILMATRKYSAFGKGVAQAFGVPTYSKDFKQRSQIGRGRPRGSFKYGISIYEYRKLMTKKNMALQNQNQIQIDQLVGRGYTPEQARNVLIQQKARTSQPNQAFKEMLEQYPVTPNTAMMLQRLDEVQNKALNDDFNMQRVQKERRMIAEKGNLLKARNLFGPSSSTLNLLGMEDNILMAKNVFAENPENKILKPRGMSILNTKEAGNDLKF